MRRLLGGFFVLLLAGASLSVFAVTLVLNTASPVPDSYDIYNFAGANMDMNNVYLSGSAPATCRAIRAPMQ